MGISFITSIVGCSATPYRKRPQQIAGKQHLHKFSILSGSSLRTESLLNGREVFDLIELAYVILKKILGTGGGKTRD
jgi:hypothetical protein